MTSGRKKSFNEEQALDAAMYVFWKKGYVGASLSDLTKSMGINKPSMYSTFGNKEELFIKATKRYVASQLEEKVALLFEASKTLRVRLKNYMYSIITMQCDSEEPKGCYLVLCQSELVGGDIPENAANLLIEIESAPKKLLTDFFMTDDEAISQGVSENASENALSLYTVLKGTASMARSGIPLSALEPVIDSILNGIGVH